MKKNTNRLKKVDFERLEKLAKPRVNNAVLKRDRHSRSVMEGGKELPIPKSMQNLDENSESLKNIKYKDQFLDVINTSNFKKNNEEKELKKNK